MTLKIAWGITGSGDHLVESVNVMVTLQKKHNFEMDVILSKAGEMVVTWYKLWDKLKQNFKRILIEKTANTPFLVGPLQLGKYDLLLVCPATANTTAKIAHGIADSLLTNCVAQAIKAGIHVYIFPVDQRPGEVVTMLPNKRQITLKMRDIDVENAEKLTKMRGITVIQSLNEIELTLLKLTNRKTMKRKDES